VGLVPGNTVHTFHVYERQHLLNHSTACGPPSRLNVTLAIGLLRGRIWPVYSLALAYQGTSAVWRLAGRLPSRLLQNTVLRYTLQKGAVSVHLAAPELHAFALSVCTWAQDERPADLHMAQPILSTKSHFFLSLNTRSQFNYQLPNGLIKVRRRWGQRHPQGANSGSNGKLNSCQTQTARIDCFSLFFFKLKTYGCHQPTHSI
jgi:hypothetical protein